MLNRLSTLAAACLLVSTATAPLALADPAPPDSGAVASAGPGVVTTPDGWNLMVSASDETQLSVPPLTTSLASREYLVGGIFTATVKGAGRTKLAGGQLEAGYQIGCGIELGKVRPTFGVGANEPFNNRGVPGNAGLQGDASVEVDLKPGTVTTVKVAATKYKDQQSQVTIANFRVTVDGCVGQSFLRSYATFTSSTADTDDVVTYVGLTETV